MLVFLHGLDSSGSGTKGRYFAEHYPEMVRPDFSGDLAARLEQLSALVTGNNDLVLVGSSYGGLMATVFALQNPDRVERLVLLAPALNFSEFVTYAQNKIAVPCFLVIGRDDSVTPERLVVPAARQVFADLRVQVVADDHLLHRTFPALDWSALLAGTEES